MAENPNNNDVDELTKLEEAYNEKQKAFEAERVRLMAKIKRLELEGNGTVNGEDTVESMDDEDEEEDFIKQASKNIVKTIKGV